MPALKGGSTQQKKHAHSLMQWLMLWKSKSRVDDAFARTTRSKLTSTTLESLYHGGLSSPIDMTSCQETTKIAIFNTRLLEL
jgi:hypothetical protein